MSIEVLNAVWLVPAIVGALWLIIVILYKGDICPGQRGRLHRSIAILCGLFAITCVTNIWLIPSALLLGWFCSQVQTKKTRLLGPRTALVIAAVWASLVGCLAFNQQLSQTYLWESVVGFGFYLVMTLLLGASVAHLLLLLARTRLQAFHRILPIGAVVMSFAYLLLWLGLVSTGLVNGIQSAESILGPLLVAISTLLIALTIWNWHLLKRVEIRKSALWMSGAGLSSSHLIFMYLLP